MKQRIKNKIFSEWRRKGAGYSLAQVLKATAGYVIYIRWKNGCDYHVSWSDGYVTKKRRYENCPVCKHYDWCKSNSKGYPVGDKFICNDFNI